MKYFATLGPMFNSKTDIAKAIELGLNGLRINLSHGPLIDKLEWIDNLRKAESLTHAKVEIILDIEGTDFRIHNNKNFKVLKGDLINVYPLKNFDFELDNNCFFLDERFINSTKVNDILSIDDGLIKARVLAKDENFMNIIFLDQGILMDKKGISNLSRVIEDIELSKSDKESIALAKEHKINSFMIPFVRNKDYILKFREFSSSIGHDNIKVYSKIEDQIGINNLDEICKYSDVIVIARGDLGANLGLFKLPKAQKNIAKKCLYNSRDFMIVTQVLDSMIYRDYPSRAEVNDIYNSILDGAAYLMLTSETANNKKALNAINFLVNTGKME